MSERIIFFDFVLAKSIFAIFSFLFFQNHTAQPSMDDGWMDPLPCAIGVLLESC